MISFLNDIINSKILSQLITLIFLNIGQFKFTYGHYYIKNNELSNLIENQYYGS